MTMMVIGVTMIMGGISTAYHYNAQLQFKEMKGHN